MLAPRLSLISHLCGAVTRHFCESQQDVYKTSFNNDVKNEDDSLPDYKSFASTLRL